jgi:hypothetical protein
MIGFYGRFAMVSVLFAAACGGSGSGGGSNASVTITAPQSGASVALGTDSLKSVPVSFTLSNFTLMAPGTCGGAANCGHLHLVIDGYTSPCNTLAGVGTEKYNVQITTGTTTSAQFASCGGTAAGAHTLTLEVHDDAHGDVNDSNGNLIKSAPVSITTHN